MSQTVKLSPSDDPSATVEVSLDVANMSLTIKNMLEDLAGGGVTDVSIPLNNVTSKVLTKVIEYCKHHVENPTKLDTDKSKEDISPWDKQFAGVDQATLFELILAANYLDIKPLLDLTCKTVANMIKGKTPEEIRKTFNIKNDFTPEEEEKVRKENEWCEER